IRFPQVNRDEFFTPLTEEELARNRTDRLSVEGWWWFAPHRKLHGEIGIWNDEDEAGGDAEGRPAVHHFLMEDGRADVTAFGTQGDFEEVYGARISYGRYLLSGSWDVLYEISQHHEDGFSSDRDDILQHRLRAALNFYYVYGCTLSLFAQASF